MTTDNKGYKFKFEHEERIGAEGESMHIYRFTSYGDTAEETINNDRKLHNAWENSVDIEMKSDNHKKDLK